MILKNNAINKMAIELERIIEGKQNCDTCNLRECFYDKVIKDKEDLEKFIEEVEEKGRGNIPLIKETIEIFRTKVDIYNRYLNLLERRELEHEEQI